MCVVNKAREDIVWSRRLGRPVPRPVARGTTESRRTQAWMQGDASAPPASIPGHLSGGRMAPARAVSGLMCAAGLTRC